MPEEPQGLSATNLGPPTAGDLLALAEECISPREDSLSGDAAASALADMVRRFFAAADGKLVLPVEMRDQLLGAWVFCLSPWPSTAGPSGVGGQAVTTCGTCAGCVLDAALRSLPPLVVTGGVCANCDQAITTEGLAVGGAPYFVHLATRLPDCNPAAMCGPYATPTTEGIS